MTPSPTSPAEKDQRGSAALGIAGASGAVGALLVSGWLGGPVRTPIALLVAPGVPSSSTAEVEEAPQAPVDLLTSGERATLDNQFDARSATFLGAVARVDSIVSIYGPGGIAKAGESGQKLLGELESGLATMRAEADRRIAAGEPAAKFGTLDVVEQRTRAFLRKNAAAPGL